MRSGKASKSGVNFPHRTAPHQRALRRHATRNEGRTDQGRHGAVRDGRRELDEDRGAFAVPDRDLLGRDDGELLERERVLRVRDGADQVCKGRWMSSVTPQSGLETACATTRRHSRER